MSVEAAAPCLSDKATGMAAPVLTEVARMLAELAREGKAGAIDLRSIPMTDADRTQLEDRLGHGEVEATLDIGGITQVRETAYPGVWWIRHQGGDGTVSSEEIAVCPVPPILKTHSADIEAAARRLQSELEATHV